MAGEIANVAQGVHMHGREPARHRRPVMPSEEPVRARAGARPLPYYAKVASLEASADLIVEPEMNREILAAQGLPPSTRPRYHPSPPIPGVSMRKTGLSPCAA
jgi:hypothetical protein